MDRQQVVLPETAHGKVGNQQKEASTELITNVHIPRYFSLSETSVLERKECSVQNQPVGLQNLGSTCWFNVVIQLLYHIPCFRQSTLELTAHQDFTSSHLSAILGLQELFLSIMFSDRKLINPSNAVHSIGKILGNAEGQQDASEFLGLVLDRLQRASSHSAVNKLFTGSFIYKTEVERKRVEEFIQLVLQVNETSTLYTLIKDNLGIAIKNVSHSLPSVAGSSHTDIEKLCLSFPAIFCIDLCRMTINADSPFPVKCNQKVVFQPWMFVDEFIDENELEISTFHDNLMDFSVRKSDMQEKLLSLQSLLESVSLIPTLIDDYTLIVDKLTSVNFQTFHHLNSSWETEIQMKMNELYSDIKLLEEQESLTKNEGFSRRLHPYRLHAVIVHQGESNQGHYWIFVWNSVEQCWYHMDDTFTQQVAWEDVSEVAFGGLDSDSSAQCLVYLDALKVNQLLDLKDDYKINSVDPIKYLKDHTDIRTRNIACGKNQTRQAILTTSLPNNQIAEGSFSLFRSIDLERRRLFALARKWNRQNAEEDFRLFHVGVYFILNNLESEPYLFWSQLQHFASFALLTDENSSRTCNAARHALVFLEKSITKQEKENFIKWNAAYYKFRLIVRHLINAINHLTGPQVNAIIAVPAAVKALCMHCALNKLVAGPNVSANSDVIHAVIERSIQLLSDDLARTELGTTDETSLTILFEGLIGWCTYSTGEHAKAASDISRDILVKWREVVNNSSENGKDSSVSQVLEGIQLKLCHLQLFLDNIEAADPDIPFAYKGHLPAIQEEGEELFHNWKELLRKFMMPQR